MTNYDVVKKIIGRLDAAGESHTDDKRYENLVDTCQLVDDLITDIANEAENSERVEFSMKRSGRHAKRFLEKLAIDLNEKL